MTERPVDAASDGFDALGLDPRLLATLSELGYEEPTAIQREAIPPLLAGRDLLAEAPTGTGKTAAFALPALERLATETHDGRPRLGADGSPRQGAADGGRADGHVAGLVLVPTRELAIQVAEAIHRYGERVGTRVLPIYGGQPIGQQLRQLHRGVDLVVATPGRAVDHLDRGSLGLDRVEIVVLDEADEMLDMGFADDLETILSATPESRQTGLFSATVSGPIARIAKKHLRDPVRITIKAERAAGGGLARVRQSAYVVRRADKLTALGRILDLEDPATALVFARTRGEVDELAERLSARGHDAAALHGGLSQEQRDRIMARFRAGDLDVLVATDVAARGLDIEHVSHVINYDVPPNPDAYVHRIGRTGRAGREGVAITLVEPREHRLLANIERTARTRLELRQVPTVADLRERRLELLRANLREALLEDGRDRLRPVIEPLLEEFDVLDVALAAVGLAERSMAGDGAEERDVAPVTLAQDRPERPNAPRGAGPRPAAPPGRAGRPGPPGPRGPRQDRGGSGGGWATLFVGAGRSAGIRRGDLVGAITGEGGVSGSAVGAIQIADRHSLVEVREELASGIAQALRGATIKGRKVPIRLEPSRGAPREEST